MRGPDGRDVIAPRSGSSVSGAPHNKRMHATRNTKALMLQPGCGRARDARRWALAYYVIAGMIS